MTQQILDGTGKGFLAKVTGDNRLQVYSKSASVQHIVSEEDENAYQIISVSEIMNGDNVLLHVTNNDSAKNMVISYIRHQVVESSGGTEFPNRSNYFKVLLGRKYVSGGTIKTAANVYSGSGNVAKISAYGDNPTLTNGYDEIDRWYTKSVGDMNSLNKEGSLIIPPNKTIELSYETNHTSGFVYTRMSFYMEEGQ